MAMTDYEQLLSTLSGFNGTDVPASNPEDLLMELAQKDPKTWLLVQYLNRQEAQEETAPPNNPEQRRLFIAVREYLERAYEELEQLRERNDRLAAALGACGLCWGEDDRCPVCSGNGKPGALVPDTEQLRRLVLPALQRLRDPEAPSTSR